MTALNWFPRSAGDDDSHKPSSFQVYSDLHFENKTGEYRSYTIDRHARFLILAGDTGKLNGNGADYLTEYRDSIQRLSQPFDAVFFIAGNAEFKSGVSPTDSSNRFAGLEMNILSTGLPGSDKCHGLAGRSYNMEPRYKVPITLIGVTLWSKIRDDAPPKTYDQFTGNSAAANNARYEQEIKYLKETVLETRRLRSHQKIMIITHHAPTIRGTAQPDREHLPSRDTKTEQFSQYQNDILGGEGIDGLRFGDVWVFGHTHFSCDFYQDDVRIISNQRGGQRNDTDAGILKTGFNRAGKVFECI